MTSLLSSYLAVGGLGEPRAVGVVTDVRGTLLEGRALGAAVGDLYKVQTRDTALQAEVVALRGNHALLMPFGSLMGLSVGAELIPQGSGADLAVGDDLLGRVVSAFIHPLDGGPIPRPSARVPLIRRPPAPHERGTVSERLDLGIRVLDAFVPCARGQRLGVFAGPGVGKSILLGMLTKASSADVVVLALVGERGREVGHFVSEILGPTGLKRSVVVAATSDSPAPERLRAAFAATAIAEHFRAQGKHVLLVVDSLTRLCMAQREIGLAVGEPPATRGYPPSAFGMLPGLVERAAPLKTGGSITGVYSVLIEGDDMTEPVADAVRGLLDGHVVLSRRMAERGIYPAVDVPKSLSRVDYSLYNPDERAAAHRVRLWLSRLEEASDLLSIGAYRAGADLELDAAVQRKTKMEDFLKQDLSETAAYADTRKRLLTLAGGS